MNDKQMHIRFNPLAMGFAFKAGYWVLIINDTHNNKQV